MLFAQSNSSREFTRVVTAVVIGACLAITSCRSPERLREQADEQGYEIIKEKQQEGLGRTENFSVEQAAETLRDRLLIEQDLPRSGPTSLGTDALQPTEHWPDDDYLDAAREARPEHAPLGKGAVPVLELSLNEALQVAARHNRDYQTEKESVFRAALALDLERDAFRSVFSAPIAGSVDGHGTSAGNVANAGGSAVAGVSRRLKQGAALSGRIAVDLTELLTQEGGSSLGLLADSSLEVPLLRGAGRWIVTEPLTQAERDARSAS